MVYIKYKNLNGLLFRFKFIDKYVFNDVKINVIHIGVFSYILMRLLFFDLCFSVGYNFLHGYS